ncbi:MAG: Calpain family cysteine protease, partial [Pseudomonadota bacterium]
MAHALANRADKPAADVSTPASPAEAKSPRTPGNALASVAVVKAAEKVGGAVDLASTLTQATSASLAGTAVEQADRATAGKATGGARRFPEGPGDTSDAKGEGSAPAQLPKLHTDHAKEGYATIAPAAAFVQAEGDAAAVDPHEVEQGELGDCYLIAGMAAVARAQPDAIGKLIQPREDGT